MKVLLFFLLLAVGISCGGENNNSSGSRKNETGQKILVELSSFVQLARLFQSDSGKVRLITLLSPT
jgi:hypothetical protein